VTDAVRTACQLTVWLCELVTVMSWELLVS